MRTQRPLVSIAMSGLCLLVLAATPFAPSGLAARARARSATTACSLLTTADASKAMEKPSQPAKQFMDSTGCFWWSDPAENDTSRRIAVNTHSVRAFGFAKKPAITTIQVQPVSGIGDEAFFQIYPNNQNPFIWFRKGNLAVSIRIITRLDPKPFTLAQEQAKLKELATAAVAKM